MITTIADNHIHSSFSEDSEATMESMIVKSIELGLRYITFTEHVDFNKFDYGYKYYNYEAYSKSIEVARQKYGDQIRILKGIEFGEPHIYQKEFEVERNRDYDVILGSIHWHKDLFYGEKALRVKYDADEIMDLYYEELIKMVKAGGVDVVAHLDFPKRYFNGFKRESHLLDYLLQEIIKSKMVLEINTSGFRKGYQNTMPESDVIEKYIEKGGQIVSIGSDAHESQHIANGFNHIIKHKQLKNCVFINRKIVMLK